MKAAGVALPALGLAVSVYGLYWAYVTACFNTESQVRSFNGSTENFGPLDAAMNFVPLGITALVAIGICGAWALRKPSVAAVLSLAQIVWLFVFAPGMWIS